MRKASTSHTSRVHSCAIESRVATLELKDAALESLTNLERRHELFELLEVLERSIDVGVLVTLVTSEYPGDDKHRELLEEAMNVFRQTARLPLSIERMGNSISQLALRLVQYDKPLITGLAGRVSGDDLGIFLASDFRVAADDCVFLFPNLRLGFPPSGPLAFFLERYAGQGRAAEILLSGRPVSSAEAHELGLITEVVAADALHRRCAELAGSLLELPAAALAATRQMVQPNLTTFADYLQRSVGLLRFSAAGEGRAR